MILDDGICTAFRKVDVAPKGGKPRYEYKALSKHWYKELDFSTVQTFPTDSREEVSVDARIRILQDRQITNKDVIVLGNVPRVTDVLKAYEVVRAFHGRDDESGEMITDVTLRRVHT